MTRALIAVGTLLALAFAGFGLLVYVNRDEDRVAVDNLLALELTRAITVADQSGGREDVDLTRLADGNWDRVLVAVPGVPRDTISAELGSPYNGDLPFGRTGQLFVFARGERLVRFADYRGRATFTGLERPLDVLPRDRAVLAVRNGVVTPAEAR